MRAYITVDSGTTNTRLYLVTDGTVVASKKLACGIKSGTEELSSVLSGKISELLTENKLNEASISRVIASGMITSEYGLCHLPHIAAPAGIKELHESMCNKAIENITPILWTFIRGVKTDGGSLDLADMMRGEETELMGIADAADGEALYILPGSHSKHISVSDKGKIMGFRTMLSGELFEALSEHTILKDSVDFEHSTVTWEKLMLGYEYAHSHGINEAIFKTRILKNLFGTSKEECYSFLLGAVLSSEVDSIVRNSENIVVIGGQKQLRYALSLLLKGYCGKKIIVLDDTVVDSSAALGAVRIFEYGD